MRRRRGRPLFDRLTQNLRRYLGYDVQYFAAIEPRKRLAPRARIAFRGAISRTDLRAVIAATYHQVRWPSTGTACYDEDQLPVRHEATGRYFDPATGELLPTWGRHAEQTRFDETSWPHGPTSTRHRLKTHQIE
jgi:hypothetical protein